MDSGSRAGMTEGEGWGTSNGGEVGGVVGWRFRNCVGGGVLGRCGWGDSKRLRL